MKRQAVALFASALLLAVPAYAQAVDTTTTTPKLSDTPRTSVPPVDGSATVATPGTNVGAGASIGTGVIAAPEGYTAMESFMGLTPAQAVGMEIKGPDGEPIGTVTSVAQGANGLIQGLVVEVGGFVGMAKHEVMLDAIQVVVFSNPAGEVVARSDVTREQLAEMAEYVKPKV